MFTFDTLPLLSLLFFIVAFLFVIHALILSYHWLSYGAKRSQSLVSLAVYLGGGSLLLLLLAIHLSFI